MNNTSPDTARDEWSVLAAIRREDLHRPSLLDIADVVQTVENQGGGQAATLAWLLSRSDETLRIVDKLRKHADDAGTLRQRGKGVVLAALCDRDLASLLDAPDDAWNQLDEIIPEGSLAPVELSAMVSARAQREEDPEHRVELERVLQKIEDSQVGRSFER